ncbi:MULTISPECIES: adenosylcobinamide-phosphate synthase CbiB [Thermoanaerobacterium]|uniref:Cobalamin biosynthesis protein CobD n=2 Tax=Thermoanaerobacterium TaxID=28895 RepID=W9E7Q0_9THEO|nr:MULTISPECIES: adenosylcobinamide-phosphate synthase CbiB [Thermoanaerobacterium]AFK85101.1 Cobalamin biosynthesis protein cbiB [Thermoanaerobacterium saccharolyticum JW/SL-YS485]ETO37527.1 cobalamin biosynthesis protein CbiB [Thermoanaerobacterium aotearoense SCUT27]
MEVIAAYFLDLMIGDPQGYPHPVRLMGKLISFLESSIRKIAKTARQQRVAGYFLCAIVVLTSYISGYFIIYIVKELNVYLGKILDILLIYTCLATNDLAKSAMRVYDPLKEDNLLEARKMLSFIVSRDTENLALGDIIRGTVETVAENISDGIIAPLFYAFIGGAPLVLAYKASSTLDSMVGYKNERYFDIGYASAKLDDILNFLPARITGLLIAASSFLLRYDYKNSFRILKRDRLKHESPNSAHGEAAIAGALNVELGGLNYYFGKPELKPKLGDGKETLRLDHIKDTVRIMYMTSFLGLILFFAFKTILTGGIYR